MELWLVDYSKSTQGSNTEFGKQMSQLFYVKFYTSLFLLRFIYPLALSILLTTQEAFVVD